MTILAKLKVIYNTEILNNLNRGSIITIIRDGDARIYKFVGFCPFDYSNDTIILSSPYKNQQNKLFRFNFRHEDDEVWIEGNVMETKEVNFHIISQLKCELDRLKHLAENSSSKKLNFIWSGSELKKVKPKTPITIIHNGKTKSLCYLTFIENPKMFLFCDYVPTSSPPIPHFTTRDIYSGDSFKIGIKRDYQLLSDLKERYNVHLNYVVVEGVYGSYNIYNQEVMKIQIFQIENLINNRLGFEQSTIKKYKDLLDDCEGVLPF